MRKIFLLVVLLGSLAIEAQNSNIKLGKDPIDKVISAMTVEEKARLLVGGSYEVTPDGKRGKDRNFVPGAFMTVAIPRLGIPAMVLTDGPAGVRIEPKRKGSDKTYYCTGFPIATMLASTWNTNLLEKVGKVIGNEVLEYGCDVLLAPGMNIHRNPLCGRNFEYYSEDPLVSGKMAAAMVNGVQSQGVGTSLKHFAANNQESLRLFNNSIVSQRALREIYLKGFEIAVKESKPWTVMASYNKLNGVFTQENRPLLTDLLRNEWNYDGLVVTDWIWPRNTKAQMHAGADLLMWGDEKQVTDIVECIKNKSLSMDDLDKNVRCMLELIVKTPHFRKYKFSDAPDLKAHAKIVREAGNEGIVLLQNDYNVLPLKNVKNIALFGKGSYNFLAGGTGSGNVNRPYVVNMEHGLENNGYVINKDISSRYKASEDRLSEMNAFFFKDRANDCDAAVITISRNSGEGGDRREIEGDFYLKKSEKDLLYATSLAFHRAGKKVIVVLNVSGVIETASWKDMADAIVLAWQPGEEGGNCVADILSGKENPSGKLTMTFPESYWDVPSSKNFPNNYVPYQGDHDDPNAQQTKNVGFTNYDEGIWIGYRYFNTKNIKVSFPFGYGLSYTSFAYTQPEIKKSGDSYVARVKVTNVGNVAGKEIVELYVSAPAGKLEKPAMELKGFNKTKLLEPGESQTIEMKFFNADLASFDEASNSWIIDEGTYKTIFASSSKSIMKTLKFKVNGSIRKMKAIINTIY